jgi:hypothetical protein
MAQENVKAFVREALGCDCDESVFEHIENEKGVKVDDIRLRNKINVGNRLLIYVADANGPSFVRSHMPELLDAGRKERDERNFNRFRLVLVAKSDSGVLLAANQMFAGSKAVDEKVHLHVMDALDVIDL